MNYLFGIDCFLDEWGIRCKVLVHVEGIFFYFSSVGKVSTCFVGFFWFYFLFEIWFEDGLLFWYRVGFMLWYGILLGWVLVCCVVEWSICVGVR